MQTITRLSRIAYGLGIIALGIHQLAYGRIDNNFFPNVPSPDIVYHVFAYTWGVLFTLSGIALLLDKRAKEVSLISGGVFLSLFLLVYCPYLAFSPDGQTLIGWAAAMETSAFVGASFIVAASYPAYTGRSRLIRWLDKLAPYGGLFFSIMLIGYGLDHFVYTKFVSGMVPSWIPSHYFWTYFAGVALIGAGIAITLKVKLQLVASLLGIMIFLWLLMIHIPTAYRDPYVQGGLELKRVYIAFGFTGICLLLALSAKNHANVTEA